MVLRLFINRQKKENELKRDTHRKSGPNRCVTERQKEGSSEGEVGVRKGFAAVGGELAIQSSSYPSIGPSSASCVAGYFVSHCKLAKF